MKADLVLEGGGVKGIAHVGAIAALEEAGYTFMRVAGSSAGAFVAAFVAAGVPAAEMRQIMLDFDFKTLPHATGIASIPLLGKVISLFLDKGVYDGDHLHKWVLDTLARYNVSTFADLRVSGEAAAGLAPNQQYKLVMIVADVSRGQLARLPWDFAEYGLAADEQKVADAVRASTSIPFFFKPVALRWGAPSKNTSVLVDGGTCSDFPIEIFDPVDDAPSAWPTIGIKLSARSAPGVLQNDVRDTLPYAAALLETAVNGNDQVHLADPCVSSRTIFIDTSAVNSTNFSLSQQDKEFLYAQGQTAARDFLAAKPWVQFEAQCTQAPGRHRRGRAARGVENPALTAISERRR